jgi:hypothetical protein
LSFDLNMKFNRQATSAWMKHFIRLGPVLLLTSCATPSDQQVSCNGIVAGIRAPQTLQLMGDSCAAGYSASDATKAIVEYYRPGEGPKSWKRMLALRLNVAGPSSRQQVVNMHQSILAGGSRAVGSYTNQSQAGYGIDFILTARGYQELDVFRYIDRTNAPGSISFQYAEIIPNQDVRGLEGSKQVEYYRSLRFKARDAIWSIPVPVIEMSPRAAPFANP